MNEYRKNELKKSIIAFLLSAGLLFGVSAAVLLLVTIGDLLGNALPYVMLVLVVFAIIWFLSIPIKDILQDRENHKRYWELKDKQRLAREADKEIARLKKEADRKEYEEMVRIRLEKKDEADRRRLENEGMRAAHAVRKRDNLV